MATYPSDQVQRLTDRLNDLVVAVRLCEQGLSAVVEDADEMRATVARLQEHDAVRVALKAADDATRSSQVIQRGQHISIGGQLGAALIGAGGAVMVWVLTRVWELWRH